MKKTLQEEKDRYLQIVEQMSYGFKPTENSEQSNSSKYSDTLKDIANSGYDETEAMNMNNNLQIDDHVFCPTHTLSISVSDGGEDKEDIMFTVKIFPDTKIVDVSFNKNDYNKEQVEQAKQMVLQRLSKTMWPSGCSFSLKNPKGNNSVEF